MLHDLGWERVSVDSRSDASATCSAIARRGAGSIKHIEIRDIQICTSVAAGDVILNNAPRECNVADVLAHTVTSSG